MTRPNRCRYYHRCTHGSPPPPFFVLLQDANFVNTSAVFLQFTSILHHALHWLRPSINQSDLRKILTNYGAAIQGDLGYKVYTNIYCFLSSSSISHLLYTPYPVLITPSSMVIIPWMFQGNITMITISLIN